MGRLARIGSLAVLALVLGAPAGQSAHVVVGGLPIQVQAAPWTVLIRQSVQNGSLFCDGTILDATLVLTAAHCVYDANGTPAAPSRLSIRAGISNFVAPLASDLEQDASIASIRIHPGYVWSRSASPDDAAVLALSAPLDLGGPAVQLAPLPAPGGAFPAGAAIGLAGFGRESISSTVDGSLNWMTGTVDNQGECGGFANMIIPSNNAIAFCATSPASAICNGDSGSALVTADASHTIIGVTSAGSAACGAGAHGVFTYVGAPEMLRFIQGEDHPPFAPRRTPSTFVSLSGEPSLRIGETVTCTSGSWDGPATLTYAFVNALTGEVLQRGAKPTFAIPARALGAPVRCQAFAANDGGTAVIATDASLPVEPAPRLGIDHVARIDGVRGRTVQVRVVLETAAGLSGKYGVCITPPARLGGRVCASRQVDEGGAGGFPLTVGLRIKPTAPVGTVKLAITAVAGISRASSTALVRVRR